MVVRAEPPGEGRGWVRVAPDGGSLERAGSAGSGVGRAIPGGKEARSGVADRVVPVGHPGVCVGVGPGQD